MMEINWHNLALASYEAAYAKRLPSTAEPWSRLSEEERFAWISAVQECVDLYSKAVLA